MPSLRKNAKKPLSQIIKTSFFEEFPIPGSMNLEKVGAQTIPNLAGAKLPGEKVPYLSPIKAEYSTEERNFYIKRKNFEEDFNSRIFNRLFGFRNLMSGAKPITWRTLLTNAFKDMIGWPERLAPEGQIIVNTAGTAFFGVKPLLTFAWGLTKKILNLPVQIAKLFVVVLPSVLYTLALKGMLAAVEEIKHINSNIHPSTSSRKKFNARLKQIGLGLLVGAAAIGFAAMRLVHFVSNAALQPRENFRRFWNDTDYPIAGKILAFVSLLTTVAVYAAAAFFLAPMMMEALSAAAISFSGTPFGAFLNGVLNVLNTVGNAISVVAEPIGAALTTALEFVAGYIPFLAPAALAAGNVAPITLGLFTLGGAAVALAGTGESMAQGALVDKYHSYAVKNSIVSDCVGNSHATLRSLGLDVSRSAGKETDPLLKPKKDQEESKVERDTDSDEELKLAKANAKSDTTTVTLDADATSPRLG